MKKPVTYLYEFENGTIEVSRGIKTKFDWYVTVNLNSIEKDGYTEKRFIKLDQNIFLTRRAAISTTEKLLRKYKLIN
jgi:hypothetical protein